MFLLAVYWLKIPGGVTYIDINYPTRAVLNGAVHILPEVYAMQDTEQINFIADCLTNYNIKIQALNKAGLFDSAKLFEYFALGSCRLWFKQNFHNLNEIQANYPYVDLVSEDGQI